MLSGEKNYKLFCPFLIFLYINSKGGYSHSEARPSALKTHINVLGKVIPVGPQLVVLNVILDGPDGFICSVVIKFMLSLYCFSRPS